MVKRKVRGESENGLWEYIASILSIVLYKPIGFVEIVNCDGLDQTVLQLRALLVKHIMEKEW